MRYIIKGIPQAQERPRFARFGKKVRVYDPPNSKQAKHRIQQELKKYDVAVIDEAMVAYIDIYVPIPRSYTKKKRKLIEEGKEHPAKKPDLSNYIKLIEDACNGILYTDDAKIVEIHSRKLYTDDPRIEFEFIPLKDNAENR
jgi:Holliday junction resolvase RusA-like endonuclease